MINPLCSISFAILSVAQNITTESENQKLFYEPLNKCLQIRSTLFNFKKQNKTLFSYELMFSYSLNINANVDAD